MWCASSEDILMLLTSNYIPCPATDNLWCDVTSSATMFSQRTEDKELAHIRRSLSTSSLPSSSAYRYHSEQQLNRYMYVLSSHIHLRETTHDAVEIN